MECDTGPSGVWPFSSRPMTLPKKSSKKIPISLNTALPETLLLEEKEGQKPFALWICCVSLLDRLLSTGGSSYSSLYLLFSLAGQSICRRRNKLGFNNDNGPNATAQYTEPSLVWPLPGSPPLLHTDPMLQPLPAPRGCPASYPLFTSCSLLPEIRSPPSVP